MLPNFQFSIFNFQSKLKFLKFKFQIILTLSLFLLFTFYFLSSPLIAHAVSQTDPIKSNATVASSSTNPDVQNNLHNWTQSVMIEVMSSLTCQLAGVDPINPRQSCLGADQKTGKIGFLPSAQKGGAIGFMGTMITVLYTPPLHTSDYFQSLAQNFGLNKKAYADTTGGTGFQSLSPLMNIWTAFRNIVYLILVIVFVVIGLAIMLRVKIDPRTVMTIQNQIPKIIIGILAVTFSFAIAGFLIDMMWMLIYLIYGVISGIPGTAGAAVGVQAFNPTAMQGKNILEIADNIRGGGILGITANTGNAMIGIISSTLGLGILSTSWMSVLIHAASVTIGFAVGLFTKGFTLFGTDIVIDRIGAGAAAGIGAEVALRWVVPYLIAYLIIFIALLTALFRLWFMLLMAYVQILLDIVLAPFWIIGGIIPGSPISLSGWLKDIGANLLAFPATIAMFMLGKVFIDAFGATQIQGQFVPPLIGNPGTTDAIGSLIGLGIILITPNIVNLLKQMLKAPKTDIGLGKAFAPGVATPGRIIGGAMNYTTGVHYEQVPGGSPGQMQMVAKGGAIGRMLRATGLSH